MKFNLPCYNMEIVVNGESGYISSVLSNDRPSEHDSPTEPFDIAVDAIESIVLAHACAGINIMSPAYIEGIETAVEAIENNI